MIMFQIWKGSCQWLLRDECFKNVVMTLKSECNLFFDYLATVQKAIVVTFISVLVWALALHL